MMWWHKGVIVNLTVVSSIPTRGNQIFHIRYFYFLALVTKQSRNIEKSVKSGERKYY